MDALAKLERIKNKFENNIVLNFIANSLTIMILAAAVSVILWAAPRGDELSLSFVPASILGAIALYALTHFPIWPVATPFAILRRAREDAEQIYSRLKIGAVVYHDDESSQALREFIKTLHDKKIGEIRIVATFLGVERNEYNLAEHFKSYFEEKLKGSFTPFVKLKLAAPDNPKSIDGVRLFAARIVSNIIQIFGKKAGGWNIEICIMDTPDVFPCWQLWGDNNLLIVPSVSENDRDLAKRLPVTIGADISKSSESDGDTSTRLRNYFDNFLFKCERERIEIWRPLIEEGTIRKIHVYKGRCSGSDHIAHGEHNGFSSMIFPTNEHEAYLDIESIDKVLRAKSPL